MTKREAYRRIAQYENGVQRQAKQRRAQRIAAGALPVLLIGGPLTAHPMPDAALERRHESSRIPPQFAARIQQIEKERKLVERVLADYLLDALVPLRPSRRGAKRKVTLRMLVDYIFENPTHRLWRITKGLGAQIGGPTKLSATTVKPLLKVLQQLDIYLPPKQSGTSAPPKTSRQRP